VSSVVIASSSRTWTTAFAHTDEIREERDTFLAGTPGGEAYNHIGGGDTTMGRGRWFHRLTMSGISDTAHPELVEGRAEAAP